MALDKPCVGFETGSRILYTRASHEMGNVIRAPARATAGTVSRRAAAIAGRPASGHIAHIAGTDQGHLPPARAPRE